jgi:hypothetical protein
MSVHRAPRDLPALAVGLLAAGALLFNGVPRAGAAPTTTGPNAALVAQLRATRALLHQADHDYKGHRVKAMHEITEAIHALHPPSAKHKKTQPQVAVKKSGPGGNEPQAVSDAQLRQAITQLQGVQGQLGSATTGNVAAASAAVTRAIQELKIALSIK